MNILIHFRTNFRPIFVTASLFSFNSIVINIYHRIAEFFIQSTRNPWTNHSVLNNRNLKKSFKNSNFNVLQIKKKLNIGYNKDKFILSWNLRIKPYILFNFHLEHNLRKYNIFWFSVLLILFFLEMILILWHFPLRKLQLRGLNKT